MKIGELSRLSGVSIDTLRYYDRIDLLRPGRQNSLRVYDQSALKTLEAVKLLKKMNYTLDEIKLLMSLDRQIDERIHAHEPLDGKMKELENMLDTKYTELIEQEKQIALAKQMLGGIRNKLKDYMNGGADHAK